MADHVGSLEEEAQKRRERLKALRKVQSTEERVLVDDDAGEPQAKQQKVSEEPDSVSLPKFRSYLPKAEDLQDKVLPKAVPPEVKALVEDQLQSAQPEVIPDDVELTNLAPRKPDWDLKRDVARNLEKLERRTQRAIAELIRERLAASKDTDLAEAVAWVAKTQEDVPVDEWNE